VSGANGCAAKSTLTPTGQLPQAEIFVLFHPDLPLNVQRFYTEGDAQRSAERIARLHRGVAVSICKVIATVVEPLPILEWTDGRISGDGQQPHVLDACNEAQRPESAEEHYRRLGGRY
jgi:hypothetical protein